MASIPASQLVSVQPGVVGTGGSPLSLNSVFLTQNAAVPIGTVQPFPTALSVSNFFGATAPEALLANVYFNGFDGSNIKPGNLFFAQYPIASVAAYARGASIASMLLASLQAILPGVVTGTIGAAFTATGSGTNLTVSALTGVIHIGDVVSGTGVPAGTTIVSQTSGTTGAAGVYVTSVATTSSAASLTTTSTTLNVTAVTSGALVAGQVLTGTGVTAGTRIVSLQSGTTGGIGNYTVSALQTAAGPTITGSPDMSVTVDGVVKSFATVNLSTATSFSAAAALLSTALGATVTYDSVRNAFQITSGTTGAASTMGYPAGGAATYLSLSQAAGAVLSQGAIASVQSTFMNAVANVTQNWGCFMTVWEPLLADKMLFSAWSNAQNQRYLYSGWDTDVTAAQSGNTTSFGPQLIAGNYSGTAVSYVSADKAAFICGAIASIDFTQRNGRVTLAFKGQSGLTADVTDPTTAANLIANGYNFYGTYATANQSFTFLQPGSMPGVWKWIDAYVNQIYLNAQLQLALMTLLSASKSLPYNALGYSMIAAACQDPINQALNFGSIRAGVPLSVQQAASVNMAAGLPIDGTLSTVGYYLQVLPATAQVRGLRQSPPCTLWYTDGGSIQKINLASIDVM